jgi:hypothetical protein
MLNKATNIYVILCPYYSKTLKTTPDSTKLQNIQQKRILLAPKLLACPFQPY